MVYSFGKIVSCVVANNYILEVNQVKKKIRRIFIRIVIIELTVNLVFLLTEDCTMAISATIWRLGSKGCDARLLYGFLKDKRE